MRRLHRLRQQRLLARERGHDVAIRGRLDGAQRLIGSRGLGDSRGVPSRGLPGPGRGGRGGGRGRAGHVRKVPGIVLVVVEELGLGVGGLGVGGKGLRVVVARGFGGVGLGGGCGCARGLGGARGGVGVEGQALYEDLAGDGAVEGLEVGADAVPVTELCLT